MLGSVHCRNELIFEDIDHRPRVGQALRMQLRFSSFKQVKRGVEIDIEMKIFDERTSKLLSTTIITLLRFGGGLKTENEKNENKNNVQSNEEIEHYLINEQHLIRSFEMIKEAGRKFAYFSGDMSECFCFFEN